ncbi:prospero homeobox protein 1-like [Thunnus maccoyii]|uniref:prospero homeobox protein 1-like n=1 Tax=Thunnus maccoyii TaxID=8240 RepID=UPI001C4D6637|nr:prospero homeobox protein 1-like [Thunnus maccoyii]XP_042246323.1 prospero homeobox protein 1-like [Thunnus maccoyii]XP_042246324.1 prospero homeobox protein 1-like [Thunnus maccoyii]XP_042246325.1 prospero homeobox protein 1-like [Thunnus maccoyii]
MNQSAWSKDIYSSSNICLDSCTAEHLPSFQPDPMLSNPDVSGASALLHKDSEKKSPPESDYYSSSDAGSSLMCSSQLELNPPGDSTRRQHPSPASRSCGHFEWNLNSGHQAKRARVENIIKGMTGSPGAHCTDVMMNQHEETDGMQGDEKMQELPLHQDHMQTRKQPQSQNQHLRQLRTRFTHMDGVSDSMDFSKESLAEEKYPTWNNSPDACTDSYSEFESGSSRKYQGWKRVKLMNYFQSKPEKIKLMADVLKYELSRAVSRSVDSIFKSMPLLQAPLNDEGNIETDLSFLNLHKQPSVCKDNKLGFLCCGSAEVQVPDVQTEALSLVVQKPQLETPDKFILQSGSRAQHRPKLPTSSFCLREDQEPQQIHNVAHQNTLRCLRGGCAEVKFDTSWNSDRIRSKVNSRSIRSPQTHTVPVDPMTLESLCLPDVKIESDSLLKHNLYMLNEGLTTNHLKKAKLMFFFTRYPSSLVLKMCFHDVQFTRCITSQLIKWFSNFREFYYIQMEKFARHAVMEGASDMRGLAVGRESELFRALNMHYNKANDFQVPDRFLEVAEITLREFYIAISMGKDRDPSWKKAIYKVICKLDSDVPAEFKSHHSG